MVIVIANQKGGVGKSTTALALWSGMRQKGFRTLLVDLDPQCNTSYAAGIVGAELTAYELLKGKAAISETIIQTLQGDIIPSDPGFANMDLELNVTGKEYRLKEALSNIESNYDYIIIDTPPALGILTVNALTAADTIIITAQSDIFSVHGLGQLYSTIDTVRNYCNPKISISGILLTRHNPRSILSRDMNIMFEETAAKVNTRVYKTIIRECISIKEAQINQQDIFTYASKSNAVKDYLEFIEEVLKNG